MNRPAILSSGSRKYTDIVTKLLECGRCTVACSRTDTTTVINGVKKEKAVWTRKNRMPKDKRLKTEVTDTGIEFQLVLDTSINNL